MLKLLGIIWITAMAFSSFSMPVSVTNAIDYNSASSENGHLLPTDTTNEGPLLEESIYLVVGVFSLKSNAAKFTEYSNKAGYPARYCLNANNNYFYVYLHSTDDLEASISERSKIISDTNIFPGIWVFDYKNNPVAEEGIASEEPEIVEDKKEAVPALEAETTIVSLATSNKVLNKSTDAIEFEKKENEYLIYPNVVYGRNFKEINAKVQVIDPVRSKLLKSVDAHELSLIQDPDNGSHSIQLIADVFGYRKVQHDLILNDLNADSVSSYIFLRGDTILIEFPMERLKTGDVATMYNVFFRNDAVVMESSSQYELNSLLEMLKENENYQIIIHGHTNGNKSGKIIKLTEENPNFFVITEENKSGYGSAKKLSTERALTIKKYLVSNGISEERMKVQGWGGKKMIYDKYSVDAKKNVRVEIEILED